MTRRKLGKQSCRKVLVLFEICKLEDLLLKLNRDRTSFFIFFFLGQCGVRLLLTEDNSISVPWLRACNFTHDAFKVSYVGLLDKLDSDR